MMKKDMYAVLRLVGGAGVCLLVACFVWQLENSSTIRFLWKSNEQYEYYHLNGLMVSYLFFFRGVYLIQQGWWALRRC
jgi:hypothetical protein